VDFDGDGLAVAFAALREPGAQGFGEAIGFYAEACFHFAIRYWKSVVKFRGVGEIAHAEGVEPIERAGFAFTGDDDFDAKFLRVHSLSIQGWNRSREKGFFLSIKRMRQSGS